MSIDSPQSRIRRKPLNSFAKIIARSIASPHNSAKTPGFRWPIHRREFTGWNAHRGKGLTAGQLSFYKKGSRGFRAIVDDDVLCDRSVEIAKWVDVFTRLFVKSYPAYFSILN